MPCDAAGIDVAFPLLDDGVIDKGIGRSGRKESSHATLV
jgi:hypothetical protein